MLNMLKTAADFALGLFVALEMEGCAHCIVGYTTLDSVL